MNDSRQRRFTVSDGHQSYVVHATQTHRPQPHSAEPKLEWQFFIEELKLILVQDGKRYISIDDANRVFRVTNSDASVEEANSGRAREAS